MTFGTPFIPPAAANKEIYSITLSLIPGQGIAAVGEQLGVFADRSLDHVMVTPQLSAASEPGDTLKGLAGKLKLGGHMVILVEVEKIVPGRAKLTPQMIEDWVAQSARWVRKAVYQQDGLWMAIYKKMEGRRGITQRQPSKSTKRVCIVRYGALGDAIVLSPLLRKYAEEGWEVTLNINPYCMPALENNPHIHNMLVQERDMVPNQLLSEYWALWGKEYDRYINLSESMEGDLLMVEGRPNFFTTKSWRHSVANKNYYDYTMERGGWPETKGAKGELYFTNAEERRAQKFFDGLRDKFVVVWALNGSSHHKVYPMMEPLLLEWFKRHEDSVAITTGDNLASLLEFEHPQLLPRAGKWAVRESMIATKYADLVIGPETMMTNAAGCYDTPKIVLLSHSTKENLTKYFTNDYSLEPEAPCYPCHQLHYSRQSCPTGEMQDMATGQVLGQAPICSMGVSPTRLLGVMEKVYAQWKGEEVVAA